MPYISQYEREKYDKLIGPLVKSLSGASPGEINYVISKLVWQIFSHLSSRSYTKGNMLMGVLECVKTEFYRRQLAPYEDEKMQENGDI